MGRVAIHMQTSDYNQSYIPIKEKWRFTTDSGERYDGLGQLLEFFREVYSKVQNTFYVLYGKIPGICNRNQLEIEFQSLGIDGIVNSETR